jgi:hypothetical protein
MAFQGAVDGVLCAEQGCQGFKESRSFLGYARFHDFLSSIISTLLRFFFSASLVTENFLNALSIGKNCALYVLHKEFQ